MRKFKRWLMERYLPAWCRGELLEENQRLRDKVERQASEIRRLNAYIDGVRDTIRKQPRITINGGGVNGDSERDL